ncbi:MAG: hypothetical protein KBC64_06905 [Simkaniaceae bacterium]|nr:hypothetical protein [Simkaniaceae bacterium]
MNISTFPLQEHISFLVGQMNLRWELPSSHLPENSQREALIPKIESLVSEILAVQGLHDEPVEKYLFLLHSNPTLERIFLEMTLVRIAQEPDPKRFKQLLQALPPSNKDTLFNMCMRDYPTHYLLFFDISNPTTLLEALERMPPRHQATALKSANITDQDLICKVAKALLAKNEEAFFNHIDDFPLEEAVIHELKLGAVQNSPHPTVIAYLFKKDTLVYPETFLLKLIETIKPEFDEYDLYNPQGDESLQTLKFCNIFTHLFKNGTLTCGEELVLNAVDLFLKDSRERIGSRLLMILEGIERSSNSEQKTALMPRFWEKVLDITLKMFSQGLISPDQQFEIALLWMPKMSFRKDRNKIIEFFATTNPDFYSLVKTWKEKDPALDWPYETMIELGMKLLSIYYRHGLSIPLYILTEIIPLASQKPDPICLLRSILQNWSFTTSHSLWALLHLKSSELNMNVDENELLTKLKPYFCLMDEDWSYLAKCCRITSLKERHQTIALMKYLTQSMSLFPPLILDHIIPSIAKCRNQFLFFELTRNLFTMLNEESQTTFQTYKQLIHSSPSKPPLAHLILPMLLIASSSEMQSKALQQTIIAILKESSMRSKMRDKISGLSQTIQLAASSLKNHPTYLIRGLQQETPQQIKTVLSQLRFLVTMKMCLSKELGEEWTPSQLTQLVSMTWKKILHIDPTLIPDFDEAFASYFYSPRTEGLLELYISHQQDEVKGCFGTFVKSLLQGTFYQERYDSAKSPHLLELSTKYPTTYSQWQEKDVPIPLHHTREDRLQVTITDDPIDLFLCGTEVVGSCQHITAPASHNRCLLGYVLDGKNKLLAIKDSEGKIVARRILRLLFDTKGAPALFLEEYYGRNAANQTELDHAMLSKATQYAHSLNLPLYMCSPLQEAIRDSTKLRSLGSCAPAEYVDAAGEINAGVYTLTPLVRLLTQPIDHDLATLHRALSVQNAIPYTQEIHDAAYCMNEKLLSDSWGEACRAYLATSGDCFSYNGDKPTGVITHPEQLLSYLQI